jgi:copper transport protein
MRLHRIILVLGAGLYGLSGTNVCAHAVLLQAQPAAGQRLAAPPAMVRLFFNEPVEPLPNSVRVVSLDRRRVDSGEVRLIDQGRGLEIPLQAVDAGRYAVFWRVHSVDGHHVRGEFGFGVEADAPDAEAISRLAGAPAGQPPDYYLPTMKWLSLTGMTVWLGGLSFLWLVLWPAAAATSSLHFPAPDAAVIRRTLTGAALLFAVAEGCTLVAHSAVISELGMLQAASPSALAFALTGTNYGHWWLIRMGCVASLLLLNWLARLSGTPPAVQSSSSAPVLVWKAVGACLALAAVFTIPLTGHARAVPNRTWLAVASDGIHLAASSIWIGGLVILTLVLISARRSGSDMRGYQAGLSRRFSRMAALSVALLLATGAYNAWLHLPARASFLGTPYGRTLLFKLALMIPLLGVAASNRRWVLPKLATTASPAQFGVAMGWLGKLVRTEAVLGIAVLGVVGSLTQIPPATAAPGAIPSIQEQRWGDFVVRLQVTPLRVGPNRLVAWVGSAGGVPMLDTRRVTFYLNMLEMSMGLQTVQAQPAGDGSYAADGRLSMAGRWRISVEVSPAQGDSFVTEFDVYAAEMEKSGGQP